MTVLKLTGIGHPWTGSPGWDQLFVCPDDGKASTMKAMVEKAKEKYWHVWFEDNKTLKCHMYKPADKTCEWEDLRWQGTPRGHGLDFKKGDYVYTDFSGAITQHHILDIERSALTLCGVRFRVTPPVPGSEHISDDPGKPVKVHGSVLIDASWFRKVEK